MFQDDDVITSQPKSVSESECWRNTLQLLSSFITVIMWEIKNSSRSINCTYMYVLRNMWTLSVGFLWCVCDNYIAKTWNIFIVLRKVLFLEPKNKVYTYVGLSHVFYNTHENCYFSSTNKFRNTFNTLTLHVV